MSAITINGTTYEADLTDLYIVRDLMDAVEASKRISSGDAITETIAFAELAKSAIERAIGAENAAEAFGGQLKLSVILDAVNQVAAAVAPAYEQLLRDITA